MPAEVSGVPMSKLKYHWFLPISSVQGSSSAFLAGYRIAIAIRGSGSKKYLPSPLDSSAATTTQALLSRRSVDVITLQRQTRPGRGGVGPVGQIRSAVAIGVGDTDLGLGLATR